jgi:maleate isomerase
MLNRHEEPHMSDVLGYRAKVAVLIPSTNTIVGPEFQSMAPPGVTFHTSRIKLTRTSMSTDAEFEALMEDIASAMPLAVDEVRDYQPDYLTMGISSETFWNGVDGHDRLKREVGERSGLPVTTGAEAVSAALRLLGLERLAVVSPYQPIGDAHVKRFLTESGFEVVRMKGLRCPTAVSIAHVTEETLRQALVELDGDDVDGLLQVGTNLAMARLADEAERWLGKSVIAVNTAIVWHTLRACGIQDRLPGFGTLLRDH